MRRHLSFALPLAFAICALTFFVVPLPGTPITVYAQNNTNTALDNEKFDEKSFNDAVKLQTKKSKKSFDEMLSGWKPANKVISNNVNVRLWEFFRSTINWILVAGLIATALANILHFNIDTYGVKKILPGLLTGFLAANFSLFICKIILDIAESLTNTAFNVVQQATGFPLAGAMFGNSLPAAITAVIAVVVTFSFLPGLGTLLGIVIVCLVVIAVLFFPILAMVALILIFIVRNYVIQFLVVGAPVAFFLMGIPMGQGVFKKWWGLFTTWTFMKPIGLWILTIGAIVMYSGVGGNFVGFIVGVASMFAAVTIPFGSGSQIFSQIQKWGGMAGKGMLQGVSSWSGSKNKVLAAVGRNVNTVRQMPSILAEERKRREGKLEREGRLNAAKSGLLNRNVYSSKLADMQDERVGELIKRHNDKTATQLGEQLAAASDPLEKAAILMLAAQRGEKDFVMDAYNKSSKRKGEKFDTTDSAQMKRLEMEMMGAKIIDEHGISVVDQESEEKLATRLGARIDAASLQRGFLHHGARQEEKDGKTTLLNNKGIADANSWQLRGGDPKGKMRQIDARNSMYGEDGNKLVTATHAAAIAQDLTTEHVIGAKGLDSKYIEEFRDNFEENAKILQDAIIEEAKKVQTGVQEAAYKRAYNEAIKIGADDLTAKAAGNAARAAAKTSADEKHDAFLTERMRNLEAYLTVIADKERDQQFRIEYKAADGSGVYRHVMRSKDSSYNNAWKDAVENVLGQKVGEVK